MMKAHSMSQTITSSTMKALSIRQVLDLTGISRPTFYSHVKAGRIVARKLGRRTIVMAADLERYLESLPRLHEISQA
jgi:excisionase family DNA binding protein